MPVECKYCGKIFSRQFTLNRHTKEIHKKEVKPVAYTKEVWGFKCLEHNCDQSFRQGLLLIQHLENDHNLKFEFEKLDFVNMDEFTSWKQSMEEETCSYYVVSKNFHKKGITYYNCNRSKTGHDGGRDLDKQYRRNYRSQGLCHMDSSCTSQMKVICDLIDGQVKVTFQKRHYGHELELAKVRLPKRVREIIAAKLVEGVTPKKIIETACENFGEHIRRIDLLTLKDVDNIKKSFGLDFPYGQSQKNAAVSLDGWVQEYMSKATDENPILYYKSQGTESPDLKQEDFCLIFMNKFQKLMIEKFGNTTISIEGTYSYDIKITIVMILDEVRQGFPVAFMLSNRKDTFIYQNFFQHLKHKVGVIQPKIFMTDLAAHYLNPWMLVMGAGNTEHIYCAFHVYRAWQNNITQIKGIEKRKEITKVLKILQQDTSEEEFETCLRNTLQLLLDDPDTQEFGSYFQQNYSENFRKWAYCFRTESLIDPNVHIEALHKILKHVDTKAVQSRDEAIILIIEFLKNRSRDKLTKLIKGKTTKCTRETFKTHCEAQKCNYELIFSDNMWQISIESGDILFVKQNQIFNCCVDICSVCNICSHVYTCTCLDFSNRKIICKHIHYIMLHIQKNKINAHITVQDVETKLEPSCDTSDKSDEDTIDKMSTKINEMLSKLHNFDFDNLDNNTLVEIQHHLNIIENLTSPPNSDKSDNSIVKNCSSKRCVEPQSPLSSMKKKRTATVTAVKVEKIPQIEPSLIISADSTLDHLYCEK